MRRSQKIVFPEGVRFPVSQSGHRMIKLVKISVDLTPAQQSIRNSVVVGLTEGSTVLGKEILMRLHDQVGQFVFGSQYAESDQSGDR